MKRSHSSRNLSQSSLLHCHTWSLSSIVLGLFSIAILSSAPAASAEGATSIEVRFSGVVHPPCYSHNPDGSMEQACELSRSEASITKPAASAPVQDHAETAGQGMDGIEDNLAIGQLHRQEVQLDRHTRITLTPS